MYKHILIPTDGSRLSETAIAAGVRLGRALGARITALHVLADVPDSLLEAWAHHNTESARGVERALGVRGTQFLEHVRDTALRAGVQCDCHVVRGNVPHDEILKSARAFGCDLIVMASHRMGAEPSILLDGETIKVLAKGEIPVLVYH